MSKSATAARTQRFTNQDGVSAHEDDQAPESYLSSTTEPIDAIRIREQSLPLIYPLLLAASAVALILILLSDHFFLT